MAGEGGEDLFEGGEELHFEGVGARSIDIDNGEEEILRTEQESSGEGEVVYGVVSKLEKPIIPSNNDAA
jgi:hypothetical protein